MKLTERQRKFIEAYDGNATAAARAAGYEGNDATLAVTGNKLLRNGKVAAEIRNRQKKKLSRFIATREDRQKFWTQVMNDPGEKMADRLRAAELLGKSEADFTDNHNVKAQLTYEDYISGTREGEPDV